MARPAAETDPRVPDALLHSWHQAEGTPCENLADGYYEVEGEDGSGDFLLSQQGHAFTGLPEWPTEPRTCRPISQPNFIQEVP